MSEHAYDPELKAVEAALARLGPASATLDRDRLMFQAGRASRPPRTWLWPAAAAVLTVACAGLATALVLRPGPQIVEHTSIVEVPLSPTGPKTPAPFTADTVVWHQAFVDYQQLQDQVLEHGLDGLPEPPPPSPSPPDSLDKLLGMPGIAWPRPNRPGT